jgi:hypothetical protein
VTGGLALGRRPTNFVAYLCATSDPILSAVRARTPSGASRLRASRSLSDDYEGNSSRIRDEPLWSTCCGKVATPVHGRRTARIVRPARGFNRD